MRQNNFLNRLFHKKEIFKNKCDFEHVKNIKRVSRCYLDKIKNIDTLAECIDIHKNLYIDKFYHKDLEPNNIFRTSQIATMQPSEIFIVEEGLPEQSIADWEMDKDSNGYEIILSMYKDLLLTAVYVYYYDYCLKVKEYELYGY